MKKRISILLFQFDAISTKDLELLYDLFKKLSYDDERGFGFYDIDFHNDYLSATMIHKAPTLISEYDSIKNIIVRKTIFIYSNINFAVDSKYNLLEVYASQKDSSKLRSVLLNNYLPDHSLTQIYFYPHKVFPLLNEITENIVINRISVENYHIEDKARGNFIINKAKQDFVIQLLHDYREDVRKISLTIDIEEYKKVELTLCLNGQLSIKANDSDDILMLFKSIILKM